MYSVFLLLYIANLNKQVILFNTVAVLSVSVLTFTTKILFFGCTANYFTYTSNNQSRATLPMLHKGYKYYLVENKLLIKTSSQYFQKEHCIQIIYEKCRRTITMMTRGAT